MSGAAYVVELLKLSRSRVTWVVTAVLLVTPPALALAFVAAAGRAGNDPMTVKARAVIRGDGWVGYLDALVQVSATGGLVGLGILMAWCVGREYAEGTLVSLYAVAVPRGDVLVAKLVLVVLWGCVLAVALVPVTVLVGLAGGLGPPDAAAWASLGRLAVLMALTTLLTVPVALVASVGRGYLPAIGAMVALVVAAQVAVVFGVGDWFPWSAPGLWAVAGPELVPTSRLALVPVSALLLGWLTRWWWQRAELT